MSVRAWRPYAIDDLGLQLSDTVIKYLLSSQSSFVIWPKTVKEFFDNITSAFSPTYMIWRRQSLEKFIKIAEIEPTLANSFIQEHSSYEWIHSITSQIASFATELEAKKIVQLDGSEDPAPSAPAFRPLGHITQLEISGPTIKSAWVSNSITRQLEANCPQTVQWTPSQPGGLPVYHGTDANLRPGLGFSESLSRQPFDALIRQFNDNQMIPRRVGGIYTAFSPFRCYIWALFKAEVIQSIPSASIRSFSDQIWTSNGIGYRGLVLIQFSSTQPKPASLTSFTIARNDETPWFHLTKDIDRQGTSDFSSYAQITHQTAPVLPDLIHGLELPGPRQELTPYAQNHWRSVWTSERARDILNANHLETFAIAFNLVEDKVPESSKPKDQKTLKGEKMGTLHRAMRKARQRLSVSSFSSA